MSPCSARTRQMLTSSARRLAAFQCAHHTIDTPNAITTHVPYKLILGHDAIAIILAQWGAVTAPIRFPGEVVTWVPAFQHGTPGTDGRRFALCLYWFELLHGRRPHSRSTNR